MRWPMCSWRCWLAAGALLLLAGCGAEVPNLHSPGTTIVCLGDSITAGVGSGGAGYPERLEELLGVPVVNLGVPGDTAAAGLARVDRAIAEDPWLVIVEFGGNDALRRIPRERTEAALAEIVERVLAAGAVPLLIELDGPFLGGLGDVFEGLEDRYRVPVLEGALGDILFDPALKSDAIHPNGDGYQRLAEEVADRVRPWLRERRETR
jgi:acyl-CoA thioesterase-1